jgi:hypothetical protein
LSGFPNPFNNHTTIRFTIPATCAVQLIIFDLDGRAVKTLAEGQKQSGTYNLEWDSDLVPGYYDCRLMAGTQTKHLGLIKIK